VPSIRKEVELLTRWLRAVCVIALITVPFALPPSAGAQTCPGTDLACTVDQVEGTAQGVTDDPGGAAQEGTDSAANTGRDAVGTAEGAANDAVGAVRNTFDQVLGDGGNTPPTGGGGGGNGESDNGDRPDGASGLGHHPRGGATSRPRGGSTGGGPSPISPTAGDEPGVPAVDLSSHPSDRGSSPTFGAVAAGVVGGIVLMVVLLGAVVAFLSFQDRIDRRDPKLTLAAVGSDRVSFG
jgi:hypothetical protein